MAAALSVCLADSRKFETAQMTVHQKSIPKTRGTGPPDTSAVPISTNRAAVEGVRSKKNVNRVGIESALTTDTAGNSNQLEMPWRELAV